MSIETYQRMQRKYYKGIITREEWEQFCTSFLEDLLRENKDILKSLKEA